MIKAPAGGMVSGVNGQFYNGGEFVPDTGLYCGKTGAKRAAKRDRAITLGRYIEVVGPESVGAKFFEVSQSEAGVSHIHYAIGIVVARNNVEAQNAFPGKLRLTTKQI
jgi:hypothetical protein